MHHLMFVHDGVGMGEVDHGLARIVAVVPDVEFRDEIEVRLLRQPAH